MFSSLLLLTCIGLSLDASEAIRSDADTTSINPAIPSNAGIDTERPVANAVSSLSAVPAVVDDAWCTSKGGNNGDGMEQTA